MTQRERRDLIRLLKKEIRTQMNEILNSMSPHYVERGFCVLQVWR